jgi:protein subunit release factor A
MHSLTQGLGNWISTESNRTTTMSIIVEVRAAEGGDDAKDLVGEQFAVYAKRCTRKGL